MRTTSSSLADGAIASSALLANTVPPSIPNAPLLDEEDQDTGDLPTGIDEDALDDDPLDTDRITSS
jgi:hypothetical protein